jgi:hypothetical protein
VDFIGLAQSRNRWWALVNAVMKLQVAQSVTSLVVLAPTGLFKFIAIYFGMLKEMCVRFQIQRPLKPILNKFVFCS